MKLSTEQQTAITSIRSWYKSNNGDPYVLSGYAGTGKTTLAKHIAGAMDNVLFCAYTGKAANVLNDKGCSPASTIHSLLYKLVKNKKDGKPEFEYYPDHAAEKASLIIVDEYSMLPDVIIMDLLKTNNKVLFLGDPFQLPPIKGFNSLEPDMVLEQIHRQALESPILRAATMVREGRSLKHGVDGDFIYLPKKEIEQSVFTDVEQLIVGRRKTRDDWNKAYMQKINMFDDFKLMDGHKVICTKNDRVKGLINGMIGKAKNVDCSRDGLNYNFTFEYLEDTFKAKTKAASFKNDKLYDRWSDSFYHAYAITCHKSQGSEFDSVLIANEPVGKTVIDCHKWLYTAITRAKNKCYLVDGV